MKGGGGSAISPHLDAPGLGGRLHARCRVDSVAKQAIARQLEAHDTGEHGANMEADADLAAALLTGADAGVEGFGDGDHVHRHVEQIDLRRIVGVEERQAGRSHVDGANRLHLPITAAGASAWER